MYSIFFHILCLSLLEVIFYFEYICPLESSIFKKTLTKIINDEYDSIIGNIDNNINITSYNISNIYNKYNIRNNFTDAKINIDEQYNNSLLSQNKRNKYNHELYLTTINYWIYYLGFISFIYIIIFLYKYYKFIKNKEIINISTDINYENDGIEFTPLRVRSSSVCSDDVQNVYINKSFINYNKIKKTYKKKILYYLLTGILILLFEYLFFTYIVMKYKILSDDEIIYQMYKIINPIINNYMLKL